MWITKTVLDDLKNDTHELRQQIIILQGSMSTMKKRLDTLAKSTTGIEYGETKQVYDGYGLFIPQRARKSVSEVIYSILEHLKLEITEIPEIEAQVKLTKIKPKKET